MEILRDDGDALRWKMRAKRSKRPPPPQPNPDEISAAQSLVLLAISGGGFCNPTVIDTASTIFTPKKQQEISPSAAVEIAAAKQKAGSPDTPLLSNNHECWVCGEVFHSSQALGGHMTSHRIKIGNAAVSDDTGRRNSAAESGRVHECSFCHERFATGQALGGHKRKHYEGPALVRKPAKWNSSTLFSNRAAGESGEECSGGGAACHDRPIFDLNLPPPPEENTHWN